MTIQVEQTPDEFLAEQISEQLIADGCVPAEQHAELAGKLAAGTITPADWRRYIEMTIMRAPAGNEHDATD